MRAMSANRTGRKLRVAVIGAGMSGILCGIRLRQEGYDDIAIYEKGDTLGGTWHWNRYPGLSCDIPSHVYSYSFALNPEWSRKYSGGEEIRAYFQRIADDYGVTPLIRFNAEVTACTFRDGRWHLEIADGRTDEADVVLCATGILHHPRMPEIEGLESFAGAAFHSACWPGGLSLKGKRVGIVGTGSTAVQIVSDIVDEVAHLDLFQRSAQWIWPESNAAYSSDEKARFRDDPAGLRHVHDRMRDMIAARFSNALVDADSEAMGQIELECRRHLEETVRDPELRRRLTPDYRAGCKRLIMSDSFYQAMQRPNANLTTEAIARIEAAGVRTADGALHELDVLVLATGFNAHQMMRPMRVSGRGGVTLEQAWADSVQAYLSISIPEFPNFFMFMGPQSPVGNFSLIEVAELEFDYILQLMNLVRDGACREVSASAPAMTDFADRVRAAMKSTIWVTGCTSWYLDGHGLPIGWPWTVEDFAQAMQAPALEDFQLVG